MDYSPPSASGRGIFQARVLDWVAISFSRWSCQPKDRTRISCIGRWILYNWATWETPINDYFTILASPVAQTVKRLPAMRETRVQFLGQEDPLEKKMAIHSSTLAWKIPWMEEPDRLQSMGLQRVGHDWATSLHFTSIYSTILLWNIHFVTKM